MRPVRIAINRTVAPGLDLDAFLALAADAGAEAVEIRNDVPGREFSDGTPAGRLAPRIAGAGLAVASINALQRFNDWTAERAAEARDLIAYAAELEAPGIVLCPVVAEDHGWSVATAEANLRRALDGLAPLLADSGVIGYVEPLGMPASTLRHQATAVEAIEDIGDGPFRLCHDTFQYFRSGDDGFFADHVGLVHVSGITRADLGRDEMMEPHRGLVDEYDIAGNVEQVARLLNAGYSGYVSFEPFDPVVQDNPRPERGLAASIGYLRSALESFGAEVCSERPIARRNV